MASLQRLTRQDYKRKKELEELRKAGAAPAELDDEGNMINPHIPKYMAEAPWYVSDGRPGLKHLKKPKIKKMAGFKEYRKRGRKTDSSKKFKKGSCANCGAGSHKEKDCCERPRKRNAKLTGENIAPDDVIFPEPEFDYDGKRDRWKNYETDEHKNLIDYSEKAEEARRIKRNKELDEMIKNGDIEKSEVEKKLEIEDNLKDSGVCLQEMNEKKRQTIRNLRTREDTAKYLLNLNLNSAYYDPKTRSMRSNPFEGQSKKTASDYLGDNFMRVSGDSQAFISQEQLASKLNSKLAETQKGAVQMASNPTKAEILVKTYADSKTNELTKKQKDLIEMYGGSEHLKNRPDVWSTSESL